MAGACGKLGAEVDPGCCGSGGADDGGKGYGTGKENDGEDGGHSGQYELGVSEAAGRYGGERKEDGGQAPSNG